MLGIAKIRDFVATSVQNSPRRKTKVAMVAMIMLNVSVAIYSWHYCV
jgi:hypothetical protein